MKHESEMELWFTEWQTPDIGLTCKINRSLHHEKTSYQTIDVLETRQFGKMLLLDGMVMTTEKDEFVYHEMITHVAMHTHPEPKRVLVVGGGDGGAIREILKHPSVEQATLAEIDEQVIAVSKEYFPDIAGALDDPRVEICIGDGIRYVEETVDTYDVILVDSTEPVGAAVGLFQKPFYQAIYRALKKDGLMVAQTESPWFNRKLISGVFQDLSSLFPITRLYTASIPTYPSGLWSFTLSSKVYDPLTVDESTLQPLSTRYYHPRLLRALFELPPFVAQLLLQGEGSSTL